MTSDAKIGLLLALVFIVAIMFVINGLPKFTDKDPSAPIQSYVEKFPDHNLAINGQSQKVARQLTDQRSYITGARVKITKADIQPATIPQSSDTAQHVRFETMLPSASAVMKETLTPAADSPIRTAAVAVPAAPSKFSAPDAPRYYTVQSGDSLASIAVKIYGPEQGNRTVNVMKIFKANTDKLKNADTIAVGQKLLIPYIAESRPDSRTTKPLFTAASKAAVKTDGSPGTYTVRDGDSLWLIAQQQLGNGSRYAEIIKLNSNIINDEEMLAVGTELKLPAR